MKLHLIYDKEKLQERLAKARCGVAVIKLVVLLKLRVKKEKIELKMLLMQLELL